MQKGNDLMILYLSVNTDLEDLVIDYIEVKLATGATVSLNWDESDIERLDGGFRARYKGVYSMRNTPMERLAVSVRCRLTGLAFMLNPGVTQISS